MKRTIYCCAIVLAALLTMGASPTTHAMTSQIVSHPSVGRQVTVPSGQWCVVHNFHINKWGCHVNVRLKSGEFYLLSYKKVGTAKACETLARQNEMNCRKG